MSENPRVPRYHIELVREGSIEIEKYVNLSNAERALEIGRKLTENADREFLIVVTLDTKLRIIGANVVSVGTLSQSVAHPREMIKMAVLQNASAMIIMHNHPSGDPAPSREDAEMTSRMAEVSKLIGIRLLDSIVIGDPGYYSFANEGRLQ